MKNGNGKAKALTMKQRRFVEELPSVEWNATQAAIRAGYSAKTAGSMAAENLQKPHIQAAIGAELDRLAKVTGVTKEEVIRGLHTEATREGAGSKHAARVTAWSWLGKHFKLFTEQVELSGSIEFDVTAVADKLAGELAGIAARQRARSVAGGIDG